MAVQLEQIKVGEWLPDLPQNQNPGVNTATNVLPLTKQSYSPVPSFARGATSALAKTPLGAFATKNNSGDPAIYTGTKNDLFIQTNGTKPNFTNVSATSGGYTVPDGWGWSFDVFDGRVYASNGADALQSAPAVDSGTAFSAVDTDAPKAKVISAIQPGFLLCGNIIDVTAGTQPQGVRWSALGAAGNGHWPLVGGSDAIAAQSDWQAVQGANGELKAICNNLPTCNAALFFEDAVFRMIYTGDSAIFAIQPIEKVRGTPSPRSVIALGQLAYYLSHDGFYVFDGTQSVPIGRQKVDAFFFRTADPNFLSQVQGVGDPLNGLIYWAFAGIGNDSGIPNYVLVYNTVIQRWSVITGFAGSNPLIGLTFGTALDDITTDLGFTLDEIPYSLDSNILAGGTPVLAAFDDSNFFGYFTGANLPFAIETTEVELSPGRRSRINSVRPLVEGDGVTVQVGTRDALNDTATFTAPRSTNTTGIVPVRTAGRYARLMLNGASGNTATHILGGEVAFSQGGNR